MSFKNILSIIFLLCLCLNKVSAKKTPETLNYSTNNKQLQEASSKEGGMAVLEAHKNTTLSSLVNSPVKKINKEMGEHFEENDILVELDEKEFNIQYAKAKAFA